MLDFVGEFEHTIDQKGRLIIPVKFRPQLGERFYFCLSLNEVCLWALPQSEWSRISEELRKIPLFDREGQNFLRIFTSSATSGELDRQGRVLIPQNLRESAGIINKEVILIGNFGKIEVWSKERWKTLKEGKVLADLAEKIYQKGNFK